MLHWPGSERPISLNNTWAESVVCFLLAVAFCLATTSNADAHSVVEVELKSCQRNSSDGVVCKLVFGSSEKATVALTGGQYSRGVDNFGNSYHAAKVSVGSESGMAVGFDVTPGLWQKARVTFEDVDPAAGVFRTLTIRFNDGYWHAADVPIEGM